MSTWQVIWWIANPLTFKPLLLLFIWWTCYLYEWTPKYYPGVVGDYLYGAVPFINDFSIHIFICNESLPLSFTHQTYISHPPPWKMCLTLDFGSYITYKTLTVMYLRPGVSIFSPFPYVAEFWKMLPWRIIAIICCEPALRQHLTYIISDTLTITLVVVFTTTWR